MALAADPPATERWWSHVKVLADDGMEGRLAGTPGYDRAAAYVADRFQYFIYGSYPVSQRWRVNIVFLMFALGVVWMLWDRAPLKKLGAFFFFVVMPLGAYVLLLGGPGATGVLRTLIMITLALAQMVFFFSLQTPRFTGGEDGIQAVPRGHLFGMISLADDRTLYWLVAAIFMAGLLAIYRIIHSPFGQVCKAIRDNEPRAISLGYRANQYKLAVFVLSASLAGLAGATKAIVFQLASLTDVHWSMSGEVVLMTLVGGMGTVFGPILGSFVIIAMENYLAQFGAWVTIIQGFVFVICVLVFREGILGLVARTLKQPL